MVSRALANVLTKEEAQERGRQVLDLVRACLYREPLPVKGGKPCANCKARCHAGKGVGGIVTMTECSACVVETVRFEGAAQGPMGAMG